MMPTVDCFKVLEDALVTGGLAEDACSLRQTRTCGYATSSEMLGALGVEVLRIRASVPQDTADSLRDVFVDCQRAVQRAWPNYALGLSR